MATTVSSSTCTSDVKETATQANPETILPDSEHMKSISNFETPFLFSDVVLEVEGEVLHSHRAILSMWSPVFRAMFNNACQESATQRVVLSQDKLADIQELLQHFYTPGGRDMDSEMALRLLPVIHRYQVDILMETLERRLCQGVNDGTAVYYLQLSETYNMEALHKAALERCARMDMAKLDKEMTESHVSGEAQLSIYKRRVAFLEQCLGDIQRSFVQSCIKMESKFERVPANHCSNHTKPLSAQESGEPCAECIENIKNHINDLCKRALRKTTVVILKD